MPWELIGQIATTITALIALGDQLGVWQAARRALDHLGAEWRDFQCWRRRRQRARKALPRQLRRPRSRHA